MSVHTYCLKPKAARGDYVYSVFQDFVRLWWLDLGLAIFFFYILKLNESIWCTLRVKVKRHGRRHRENAPCKSQPAPARGPTGGILPHREAVLDLPSQFPGQTGRVLHLRSVKLFSVDYETVAGQIRQIGD